MQLDKIQRLNWISSFPRRYQPNIAMGRDSVLVVMESTSEKEYDVTEEKIDQSVIMVINRDRLYSSLLIFITKANIIT